MKRLMHIFPAFIAALFGTITMSTPINAAALPTLTLVNQTFNVTTATQLGFVFDDDSRFVGNAVEIELHRRVASRRSFQSIARGQARPGVLDALTLSSYQIRRINENVQFSVPLTQGTDTAQSLHVVFDGVYPITIRIRDSKSREAVAEVLTFINVHRNNDPAKTVQVSTLVRLKTTPSLQPDGSVVLTDETRTRVSQFVDFLQSRSYPITVSVQPEIIEALATSTVNSDKVLFISLQDQLQQRSITASPYVSTDPSMFATMNMREEFIEQLRVGEDILHKWLPNVNIQRGTYIADHYLSSEGLKLLRTAGIVSVILSSRAQQDINVSRSSNVVMKPSGVNSNNMSIIAVDSAIASSTLVVDSAHSPAETAYRAAAELLTARDDLLASGHSPSSIRLLLSTPTGVIGNSSTLSIASNALSASGGVRFVDMSGPQIASSDSSSVQFSSTTPNTGAARSSDISIARKELNATASMTQLSDERRELWSHLFAAGVSNTVIDGDEYLIGLRTQLKKARESVTVTTPENITLSGRNGAIRIQLRNSSAYPLTVRVHMSSAKLKLRDPVRLVDLAAGSTTEVKVDAGIRSNGRFPISIRVTTPEGAQQVLPFIRVTARMNAIAGFGQYLSLFLLVMVLLWWWTHWRRARSERVRGTTVSN
jgi:hypothetical protein